METVNQEPRLNQLPGVVIGTLTGVDGHGQPLVRCSSADSVRAEAVWMQDAPDWNTCVGHRVVLGFVDGDSVRPVILGLLDAPRRHPQSKPKTLKIESGKELVIECGKSKIAMRADGRIEIRGGHLISRSSGPNKIKGGSVHLN